MAKSNYSQRSISVIERYRRFAEFVSTRAIVFLAVGALIGILLFFVELAFAFSLQAFLVVIKVMSEDAAKLPSFFPSTNLISVLAVVALVGMCRGGLQWSQVYLTSATFEHQRRFQRFRLVQWAFRNHSVSGSHLFALFEDTSRGSGNFLLGLQAVAQIVPTAVALWFGLAWLAFWPTMFATILLGLLAILMRGFDVLIREVGRESGLQTQLTSGLLMRNLKNLFLLHVYGTGDIEEAKVKATISRDYEVALRFQRLGGVKFVTPIVLGGLILCAITFVAERTGYFATSSILVSYFYLFVRFVQILSEIARAFSTMMFYEPRYVQLRDWWLRDGGSSPNSIDLPSPPSISSLSEPVGWRIVDVAFQYPGADSFVLKKFSLDVAPGSALVISGVSGSGKSTLLNLLMGNLLPSAGSIEVYSLNMKPTALASVQQALFQGLGYVGPESFLIEGTLRENLVYGLRREPSEAEIDEALSLAECSFVSTLPKGLGHLLTDQGAGLSAGQKQRLSLARALLRRPRVLVLDEATANLDEDTESRLVGALRGLRGRMTIIAVTHRQALNAIADQRVSLDIVRP